MTDQLLAALRDVVGDRGVLDDPADLAPYLHEWRGLYKGACRAVVLPRETAEVAAVVRLAGAFGAPIVPQGGNTGLVGGAVGDPGCLILGFGRMKRARAIDPDGRWLVAEAGVTLGEVQRLAVENGRHYPLSLASEGTCTVGGTLSTNAGGTAVLRYGMARALVEGIEFVAPNGEIVDDLAGAAPHLHQLLIGGEGTLGLITAARLRLFPAIRERATAYVGVADPAHAITLLGRLAEAGGDCLSTFELMNQPGVAMVLKHVAGAVEPLSEPQPWAILAEFTAPEPRGLADRMEGALGAALEDGIVADAVIAQSDGQAAALWRVREALSDAQGFEGGSIKHDVSVPVAAVPEFIARATAAVVDLIPGVRPVTFGHVGDGNIHFNLTQPLGADRAAFLAQWQDANRIVHDIVEALGGSFSAEHGIGRLKVGELEHYKSPAILDSLRRVKRAFDPSNLLNPGKVVIP